MMVGAMPVGRSYPGAATVAGLVQLEGARAAWKLSLNFILSYNYFSLLSYFFIAFSFLSRKSNVMVKCVTEVTQRLDVDVDDKTVWIRAQQILGSTSIGELSSFVNLCWGV